MEQDFDAEAEERDFAERCASTAEGAAKRARIGQTLVIVVGASGYAEARKRLAAALAFKPGHEMLGIEGGVTTQVAQATVVRFLVEGLTQCTCHAGKAEVFIH